MDHDEPADEDSDIIGLAALFCYGCLLTVFWATRPIAREGFDPSWAVWMLAGLFTLLPMLTTFILLYSSGWHHAWPKPKRVLRAILASCAIYASNILMICWLTMASCLYEGLGG